MDNVKNIKAEIDNKEKEKSETEFYFEVVLKSNFEQDFTIENKKEIKKKTITLKK